MTNDKYELAEWLIQTAKTHGAQAVSVSIGEGKSSEVSIREKKIDTLKENVGSGLTIRLYVDNKYSAHSTNRMDKAELTNFIKEAVISTRYLAEDPYRKLPDPKLYFKGSNIDLKNFDPAFQEVESEQKVALAKALEQEIYGSDQRIISIESNYTDGASENLLVTSNGFSGEVKDSHFSLYLNTSIRGENDARPEGYWYESHSFFAQLIKEGFGKKALDRALSRLGQKQGKSGTFPMILDHHVSSRMLSPVISALSGSNLQQKNSFLINKLGQVVGSPQLELIDDPHIIGGLGSKLFDGEGLATRKRKVFEKGTLQTYFIDTYHAAKLEVEATSGSTSNLVLQPGTQSLEELIAQVDTAYMVSAFNGGNCNSTTGDFSYGIDGFLIKKGKIESPVTEMNISGNMLELWASLVAVGNDPKMNSSWRVPSLMFDKVNFSGL